MSTALVASGANYEVSSGLSFGDDESFVTLRMKGQLFGIPVFMVRDVLKEQKVTPVPLSRPEIAGSANLRGRIVTVIDMRRRLSLSAREDDKRPMNVVVEYGDELYSLQVDSVGDVLSLPIQRFEKSPPNLAENWKDIATGVYRLDEELLVVVDIPGLLKLGA